MPSAQEGDVPSPEPKHHIFENLSLAQIKRATANAFPQWSGTYICANWRRVMGFARDTYTPSTEGGAA
jgi:hypothetical protein